MPSTAQILFINVATTAVAAASALEATAAERSPMSSHKNNTTSTIIRQAAAATTSTTTTQTATATATTTTTNMAASTLNSLTNISDTLVESFSATASAASSDPALDAGECTSMEELHTSYFGVQLVVPEWEAMLTAIVLSVIIVLTIIGNILVILSVFTYKPLRIVQNFFIVSLAVADLTVALLVLPFNVAYSILGRWEFGIHLCKLWLTCDILCCTSSILNLCAIALDRYWAITDPINYAQKRTVGRVLMLISGVWVLSLLISSPPLLGWNDWPDEFTSATPCELTSERGYVIYSSLGSFFIPLAVMTLVYYEIFRATKQRLRERAKASKMNTIGMKSSDAQAALESGMRPGGASTSKGHAITTYCSSLLCCGRDTTNFSAPMIQQDDQESISSETRIHNDPKDELQQQLQRQQQPQQQPLQHGEHRVIVVAHVKKTRRAKIKDSIKHGKARSRSRQANEKHVSNNSNSEMPHKSSTADKSSAEQVPETNLKTADADISKIDAGEISTESGSDPKGCIQVCVSNAADAGENASLKITPPQSSAGAASSMAAVPLQKKTVYQFIEEKQKISLSKERRAARTLGIIMGVFVICWLPFFLMYVILPFCPSCCPTNKFKNFITWLGYINSGLNPVIYTIFNLDYRRAFKRLLGIN